MSGTVGPPRSSNTSSICEKDGMHLNMDHGLHIDSYNDTITESRLYSFMVNSTNSSKEDNSDS